MYKVSSWCYIKSSEVCLRSPGLQLAILLTHVFGLLCSEHGIWCFLFRTLCNGNVFTWNEQCKDALDVFDALCYARIVSLRATGGSQEVMSPFFYFMLFTSWTCENFTELHNNIVGGILICQCNLHVYGHPSATFLYRMFRFREFETIFNFTQFFVIPSVC